jgi:uncharacterized protein YdeI (BOF family)
MKKLVLSAAILLGSMSSFAQTAAAVKPQAAKQAVQDSFKEIKATELPETVKKALSTDYPDASVSKAYINDKKEYKLDIAMGDQKATVYTDANGAWLKK